MNRQDLPPEDFPTLDTDLGEALGERGGKTRRVCIATPDILGPVKNGGIGTAYHHLARLLAEGGHKVVIAYVTRDAADTRLMERTRAFYAGFGISFVPIVPHPAARTVLAQVAAPAWTLHDWLRARERPFDVVHVSDWRGLGYGPLLAKSLGLAFGATHFVVHGHASTLWAVEGNGQLLSSERELGWVFMERRSVELADTLTCGSVHLLSWMRDAGYAMPERSFVWPNPFPAPETAPAAAAARVARNGATLDEVVFFGRLEPRKGLFLFVDAVDRLVRQGRAPARITFLGKASPRIDGLGFIRSAARNWPVVVRTITDLGAEDAVAYLSQPGRLAVLPSLQENSSLAVTECLHTGIPFVATAIGGTPELVAPEDRDRALVAPDHLALGERIVELAAAPLRAVRPHWDFERSRKGLVALARPGRAGRGFRRTLCAARALRPHPDPAGHRVHHPSRAPRTATHGRRQRARPGLPLPRCGASSMTAARAAPRSRPSTRLRPASPSAAGACSDRTTASRVPRATPPQRRRTGSGCSSSTTTTSCSPTPSRAWCAPRASPARDCVPAASIRFSGDGDPLTDTASRGTPIRFLGAARAWCRFRNVVGDTCALVRREAFLAVGGFDEEYRVGLEDLSFFNRLIHAGHRVEPMPDPAYFYRFADTSTKRLNRSPEAAQLRVLAPYLHGVSDEERAFCSFALARLNAPAIRNRRGGVAAKLVKVWRWAWRRCVQWIPWPVRRFS